MEKNGYILFPGAFYRSDVWQDVPGDYVKMYIDLSFCVEYKESDYDCKYGKVHLKKGEMVTSYRHLAERWKCSLNGAWKIIKFFIDNKLVSMKSVKRHGERGCERYSILTINALADSEERHGERGCEQDNNNSNKSLSGDKDNNRKSPKKNFMIPSPEEVQHYLLEINETRMTGQQFCDYYESVGWTVGRNKPMKSWQACVRTWINNLNKGQSNGRYITKQELAAQQHQEFVKHIEAKLTQPAHKRRELPF